jgi:hypothetical protein
MSNVKERLLDVVSTLPEEMQEQVLDYAEFLERKQFAEAESDAPNAEDLDPEDDPILDFAGSVDCEPMADDIDDELYG